MYEVDDELKSQSNVHTYTRSLMLPSFLIAFRFQDWSEFIKVWLQIYERITRIAAPLQKVDWQGLW
jgi:hypothetical protein